MLTNFENLEKTLMTTEPTNNSSIGTVAVIGTGTIGAPVAKNLDKHGFTVRVWNRSAAKASALTAGSGIAAFDTVAEAVQGADIIVTVLKDGPAVLEALRQSFLPEHSGSS
ncbi:IgiB [Renibacterium salmoninarum ATCC 33209]|uniref:IgiB n=1 Tax=Renibacterium salmoninarum (strain ATCC 33209 / DSM 20767 / JCM 11484 / NBRC 15589 / NCIMB 2235) TaxID=288705 RepID=A9WQW8_RENSM|nr:IgiB [Renibacterium salmoninarum ATCC 33209]